MITAGVWRRLEIGTSAGKTRHNTIHRLKTVLGELKAPLDVTIDAEAVEKVRQLAKASGMCTPRIAAAANALALHGHDLVAAVNMLREEEGLADADPAIFDEAREVGDEETGAAGSSGAHVAASGGSGERPRAKAEAEEGGGWGGHGADNGDAYDGAEPHTDAGGGGADDGARARSGRHATRRMAAADQR